MRETLDPPGRLSGRQRPEADEVEGGEEQQRPGNGAATFLGNNPAWSTDITSLDGARYLQVRLTFINSVQSGLSLTLSALGFAFSKN